MALLWPKKEKNTRSARKCLPKDNLNEGNVCGHCGEALTKLTELIAGLDKAIRPNSIDHLAGKPHYDSG